MDETHCSAAHADAPSISTRPPSGAADRPRIRLIATDLDGTLLDDEKRVPAEFDAVERRLAARGVLFVIASGRQYYNLAEHFASIKDTAVLLAENGTYVMYRDEEIHLNTLDGRSAARLIEVGRTVEDAYPIVCGKSSAWVESRDARLLDEVGKYYKRLRIVDDLTLVEDDVLKVTLCDFQDAESNSWRYFRAYEQEFKVAVAGKIWLDVTHVTANKGTALARVQEKFGIAPEDTMVFGDYLNDFEMMTAGTWSYAMKNAHPEILRVARYVTERDNNENGVLETIKRVVLGE